MIYDVSAAYAAYGVDPGSRSYATWRVTPHFPGHTPTSRWLHPGYRIQHAAYRIQESKDAKARYRMHRTEGQRILDAHPGLSA